MYIHEFIEVKQKELGRFLDHMEEFYPEINNEPLEVWEEQFEAFWNVEQERDNER